MVDFLSCNVGFYFVIYFAIVSCDRPDTVTSGSVGAGMTAPIRLAVRWCADMTDPMRLAVRWCAGMTGLIRVRVGLLLRKNSLRF